MRLQITPALPVGTACLPGAAEGATIAPLQWVEYALVNPFDSDEVGADFMDFEGMFYIDLDPSNPSYLLKDTTASDLLESPNVVLVRRILDSTTGDVKLNTTQVIAEFVSNFQVSFLLDTNSGTTNAPAISNDPISGSGAEATINDNPEQVRTIIIDLGIRNPLEDPSILYSTNTSAGTRFEVNENQIGSARVRHMRIEIPVMNVARRNL